MLLDAGTSALLAWRAHAHCAPSGAVVDDCGFGAPAWVKTFMQGRERARRACVAVVGMRRYRRCAAMESNALGTSSPPPTSAPAHTQPPRRDQVPRQAHLADAHIPRLDRRTLCGAELSNGHDDLMRATTAGRVVTRRARMNRAGFHSKLSTTASLMRGELRGLLCCFCCDFLAVDPCTRCSGASCANLAPTSCQQQPRDRGGQQGSLEARRAGLGFGAQLGKEFV